MTPDEYRQKHKRCATCVYYEKNNKFFQALPSYYCLAKNKTTFDSKGRFCKVYKAKDFKGGNELVDKIHRVDVDFSTQLEKAMKLRDIGPTKLARKSGVQRSQICRYLTAEIAPTTNNIRRLSIALNVTTDYLLGLAKTDER